MTTEQDLVIKKEKTIKVLENVNNLPTISAVMLETARMLEDPTTSTTLLSKIIGRDQGLATKLLAISNSPLYGLPRKVSTIDFAILVIGYHDVKNIIVALSMMDAFKNMNDANLNYKDLWLHSFLVGTFARRVAIDMELRISGEVFISGLLHDMGIAVIHKYFHSAFVKIIDSVKTNENFLEAEIENLGVSHQVIGHYLTEKWNLPVQLCQTILNHHMPSKANDKSEISSIVHLADYMIKRWGIGTAYWDKDLVLDEYVLHSLGFKDEEDMVERLSKYKSTLEEEAKLIKF